MGLFNHAARMSVWAAGVKATTWGRVDRARYLAAQNIPGSPARRIGDRHSSDQALGIRMKSVSDHHVGGPCLDKVAQIHVTKPVDLLHAQWFGHYLFHSHPRVERVVGVLKDDLHSSPDWLHLFV